MRARRKESDRKHEKERKEIEIQGTDGRTVVRT